MSDFVPLDCGHGIYQDDSYYTDGIETFCKDCITDILCDMPTDEFIKMIDITTAELIEKLGIDFDVIAESHGYVREEYGIPEWSYE